MNRQIIRVKLAFLLGVAFLSVSGLTGCATKAQTAAATAGGLLAVGLGIPALTNSRLDIAVDMYAPTDAQRKDMRLNRRPALMQSIHDRREADDPVRNPTPQNMIEVSVALRPIIPILETNIATLTRSANQLRPLAGYQNVVATLDRQRQAAIAAVEAWNAFDATMTANLPKLDDPKVLGNLAVKLFALRERTDPKRRFDVVNQDYLDFLKRALSGALLTDLNVAKPANLAELNSKVPAELAMIKDDPSAPAVNRIALILDGARRALALVPGDHENVDRLLAAFGFPFDSRTLASLDSATAIANFLILPPPANCESVPMASKVDPLTAAHVATQIDRCKTLVYVNTFVFSRATADVNFGPISNEVTQVLQAANRGLGIISDPTNAERWRLDAAYAVSDAGPGNHNSIIYFENMGLPVVKSSAFDPTKFVVAAGAVYKQVFSAAVAAFGAPLPATAGAAGAPDMQSSNVIATRARVRNAEKAAAAARQKILDALKVAIDEQKKATDAAWTKDSAAVIKSAQDALQAAATQLEATAGSK
jgi:hypothetical protein